MQNKLKTKAQQKVRENYRLSVRQAIMYVCVFCFFVLCLSKKFKTKVRENYRLSVRQAREEEELMRQQAARREAGLEGRRSKIFVKFCIFICFFFCRQFCYFGIFFVSHTIFMFPTRGRLRRALAGLGVVDGGVDDKDDEERETPLLKETECPVCLQVRPKLRNKFLDEKRQ